MDTTTHTVSVLSRLVQLERDRLFAFEAAIQGVQDGDLRSHLIAFRADHAADLDRLEDAMRANEAAPPETESLHGARTESRIAAAAVVGDDDLLERVAMSEQEAIDAYAQAVADEELSEPLRQDLKKKLEVEIRHREWMRKWLSALD